MSIESLAIRYNEFQSDYGSHASKDYPSIIENLFSPEFRKTANGQILTHQASELEGQLLSVRNFAGTWSIHPKEIIPSACDKKCTIEYTLTSEKAGTFHVIAILTAKDQKIDSIHEVYYQIT